MDDQPPDARAWNRRTHWVAAALLLMSMAFVFARTGRDALYFQARGVRDLPKAYMGLAVLALPSALMALTAMRRLGPRATRVLGTSLVAALLAVYAAVARSGGGPVMTGFFLMVPLAFGILFSLAWLLAADLLDQAPRAVLARCYGTLGASSLAGGVIAGLVAKLLAPRIDPQVFLGMGAAFLAAAAMTLAIAQRRHPTRMRAPAMGTRAEPPGALALAHDSLSLLRTPYTALLLAIGMAGGLVGVLIEFQFYLAAATGSGSGRSNAGFFASFYLVLNLVALLVQLYAMPRVQRRLGVPGSLLVLPAALLGGSAALLGNASLLVRSLLRVTEGGLKSSLHRSTWEQAYVPLGAAQRVTAKLLVDGAGARLAEGGAAVLVYAWLRCVVGDGPLIGHGTGWVTWALLAACAAWLALTQLLRRTLAAAVAAPGAADELRLEIPLPDT